MSSPVFAIMLLVGSLGRIRMISDAYRCPEGISDTGSKGLAVQSSSGPSWKATMVLKTMDHKQLWIKSEQACPNREIMLQPLHSGVQQSGQMLSPERN